MTTSRRREPHVPSVLVGRGARMLVVAALIALPLLMTSSGPAAAATIPDPGWVVTVTPRENLVDGQRVSVNIRSRADVSVFNVAIRECRTDTTYTSPDDFAPSAGKCPRGALSSSADAFVSRSALQGISERIQTSAGMDLPFRVGSGVATWAETTGAFTLSCNETSPCAIVVELQILAGDHLDSVYAKVPISFVLGDPVGACGGPASGALNTQGPDRLSDAWANWTRRLCESAPGTGAATRASFGSEESAVKDFAEGALDVAYTAVGYNSDVGLAARATTQRNAVAVPIGVNAAVIAVANGYKPPPGDKVPYPTIQLTPADAAAMFAGGLGWVSDPSQPYRSSILTRNPVLSGQLVQLGPVERGVLGASTPDASTWFLTDFFTRRSPDAWIVPNTGPPAIARGPITGLALADPALPEVNTFTGRPALRKLADQAFNDANTGPIWVMTDLATARALGMTAVAIQTPSGSFVEPDAASMNAAVSTMAADPNGVLLPDLGASAAVTAAYPLTFVEYALVPAEPLVDTTTCSLRSDAQSNLKRWLAFVVGDGQRSLPEGILPLPDSLKTVANEQLARVGASAVTGSCAAAFGGGSGQPVAAGSGGGVNAGLANGVPSTNPSGSVSKPFTGPVSNASSAAAAPSDGVAERAIAAVPAFAGRTLPDTTGGVIALAGIVFVTSLAAWLTAGRSGGALALDGTAMGGVGVRAERRSNAGLVLLWSGVVAAGVGLVVYQLGPLLQQQDQAELMRKFSVTLRHSANEGSALGGVTEVSTAPEPGDPVAVLEVGGIRTQAVVVEGVGPSQTEQGPGHVPGTAGPGQPGNSVVVAHRNGFGGPFANVGSLQRGDRVLVTTRQGQSVYRVASVRSLTLVGDDDASSSSSAAGKAGGKRTETTVEDLYGPSDDDRLTLVTSASRAFWNADRATVVTAKLVGQPFEPTPQGGRSDRATGGSGDSGAWAQVVLVSVLYAGAVVGSVMLYRRMRFRTAYILTVAPLVALTVLMGITLSRLLPAWL